MNVAGGGRESGEVKFGFVGGEHDGAVRVADGNRMAGWSLVKDGCIDGAKVCRAAGVGNGVGWGGREE